MLHCDHDCDRDCDCSELVEMKLVVGTHEEVEGRHFTSAAVPATNEAAARSQLPAKSR